MRHEPAPAGVIGFSLSPGKPNAVINGLASAFSTSSTVISLPPSPAARARETARREADTGESLYRRGQYREALDRFSVALRLAPQEAEFHYKLACAAWQAEELNRVEPHLRQAAHFQPRLPVVQEALALWLLQQGQVEQAMKHSTAALAMEPDNSEYIITHSDILTVLGDTAAAWRFLSPLISRGETGVWLARAYAKIAPRIGHVDQAIELIGRSLQSANLATTDRARIHFAAAELLDRSGRYDQAFAHAVLANQSMERSFDAAGHALSVSHRIEYFTPRRLASLPRASHGNTRPVLIVGMPRSGTTLVEQILASHPAIHGCGELSKLSEVSALLAKADAPAGTRFPDCFDHLSLRRANELAGEYLSAIGSLNSTARYVTDKMPMNFLFLGTAEVLLPDCHVIHCVRDPRDTCLSCFFTDFGARNQFGFGLENLASVYRDYRRLMDHWKSVLKIPILDVRYEEMVADQAGQTRRMLDFLDLPWEPRCLNFHETRRTVATASRDQVRRPMYASSVGRWKNYEKHMGELLSLAD